MGKVIKQSLKRYGIPSRFVVSRDSALSSVIVENELLTKKGCDIVVLQSPKETHVGKTLCVQPWRAFSARDYGRPERNVKSGMLPPKVARMIVNIAAPRQNETVLDPFCGSGTVLQEALLMGHRHVVGIDVNANAIRAARQNLAWLHLSIPKLVVADVRNLAHVLPPHSVNCIVSEGMLGPPTPHNITDIREKLQLFYEEVFSAFPSILKPGAVVVIALPAWRRGGRITTLHYEKILQKGHCHPFHTPLLYGRQTAVVLRDIHFLTYQPRRG